MNFNRIPPSFGRDIAADDAWTCNHSSTCQTQSGQNRVSGSFRIRTVAAAVALLSCTPGAMFAEHHQNSGGNKSHGQQLSALTCSSGSLTGAGTDACKATLTQTATSTTTVTLASSSSAVKVPASVTIASGATSASFTATASAVSSAQTAKLTASDSSNSETYSLQLKPAATKTAGLKLGATSVAFGSVNLNTPATQTVQLTSSGTASLSISAATIKGTGFSLSGITTPMTLSAGKTATLNLQFDPAAAGADTGTVTISSNAASGATSTISLSGTGTTSAGYQVALTWAAPANSGVAVTGYNIYRAASGGTYQLLNKSVNQPTSYTDATVQSGTSYAYEVMSVDASGAQSVPSNIYAAAVP
jgi:Abnormal spindle-like microcephaly-assoc'd, ASPM-SPD-2-Hydin